VSSCAGATEAKAAGTEARVGAGVWLGDQGHGCREGRRVLRQPERCGMLLALLFFLLWQTAFKNYILISSFCMTGQLSREYVRRRRQDAGGDHDR